MSSLVVVLKIAANTHHMKHPFYEGELPIKNGRYTHWQKKGILVFAVVSIYSLGVAGCFFIGMAYLKSKRIVQTREENSTVQAAAKKAGVGHPKRQTANVGLTQKLDQAKNTIVSAIEQISPLDDRSTLAVGLLIVKIKNGAGQVGQSNCFLSFHENPDLKESVQTQIEAILNEAVKEIHIGQKFMIDWTVLIKKSNPPEHLFYALFGKEVETPLRSGGGTGRKQFSQIDAKEAFETILTDKGCEPHLLHPFAFPIR